MITIGLLTNSITSPNYGVNALSISNLILIEKCMNTLNVNHQYVLFCNSKETDNKFTELRRLVDAFNHVKVRFEPELEFRKIGSFWHFVGVIKECDVFFDTSGGDSYSDIYGHNRILHQIIPKLIVLRLGKDLIFTPQTIGPFKNAIWKRICRGIMSRSTAVFVRDNISYDIATNELRLNNSYVATDMAMILPYSKTNNKASIMRVGLNVSGLLYNGGYTENNQFSLIADYPLMIDRIIEMLLKDYNCKIYLIPHVVTAGTESDNEVCDLLKRKYPNIYYNGDYGGPIQTKSCIATMDLFVGSRMHSTIAAISSGVPVIPLSYSRKFEGLFDSIGYNECIDLRKSSVDEVLKRIKYNLENIEDLKNKVANSIIIINNKMETYQHRLKELMEKYSE